MSDEQTSAAAAAIEAVDERIGEARADLEQLVRIRSISADPDRYGDVRASADATVELLRAHGLEHVRTAGVEGSQPFVIGEWMHAGPDVPTVLLYAHHDVQPPGIVENWASDPFEPEERGGRLYGRGAADDKAGAVAHAYAVGAWLRATGALPCNVRVLVEGEEEIGSPTLHAFLTSHLEELRSDVLVLADAGNWQVGIPGLTYSLRGLAAADIELRALDGPQHSGMSGGAIPDPVMALSRVLASLVDEYGDVAFDGGFDGLLEAAAGERAPIAGFDDAPDRFSARSACARACTSPATRPPPCTSGCGCGRASPSSGSTATRSRVRRTRSSPGPRRGVSLRLGPGQVPERVLEGLRRHVERAVPWGLECTFTALEGAPAWQTDPTGPAFDAARRALHAGFGVEPVLMGVGGSIPFVGPFADAFGGIPALLMGPDDPHSNIHGEDESLHLADWRSLIRSEVFLLDELAHLGA